ncbi:MAG TPA: TIGR02266 family protein [Kofleriaceae bacterium]|nr:TIGR02266 family protein [Kofleriaceae bacterium]
MADPNTRTGKRTPVTLKIKFKSETLEQFIERYAVDVSQGGIFIRTKEPLAVGTQMRFEFQLRDASPLIGGEGTVVWTRENDPSRPAIAPGMGVRFDRLAEGSQAVLERILTEKAKQTPNRPASDSIRPPLFTDTPTRVAPAPIQEQLLNAYAEKQKAKRAAEEEQHTPLPKPMPFATDADEFPDEAFEEATKVRALDELVAQTADGSGASEPDAGTPEPSAIAPPSDELAKRRATPAGQQTGGRFSDVESIPELPSPPQTDSAKPGRLLDTTPSPRTEPSSAPTKLTDSPSSRTKLGLGLEAPPMPIKTPVTNPLDGPGPGPSMGGPMSHGTGGRAVATDAGSSRPITQTGGSGASKAILLVILLVAAGAAVWYFVLRDKGTKPSTGTGSSGSSMVASGSNPAGSGNTPTGSGGSMGAGTGPGTGGTQVEAPKNPTVDTVIEANVPKAQVEVVGTEQIGEVPFTAKLEKDKSYKVRVSASGYMTLEVDVVGGSAPKQSAALVAKPRFLSIKSEPPGAVISIDGFPIGGKVTPQEIELTKAQVAKKSLKVRLFRNGFRLVEKTIAADGFNEEITRMVATVEETLLPQAAVIRPPNTGSGGGTGTPTGPGPGSGSGTGTPTGGSATPPPDTTPPPPPPPPAGGGGSAAPSP